MSRSLLALSLAGALASFPPEVVAQPARPANAVDLGFTVSVDPVRHDGYPYITSVRRGPASGAMHLAVGDVIIAADGHDAREHPILEARDYGTSHVLRVRRGDQEFELLYAFRERGVIVEGGAPTSQPRLPGLGFSTIMRPGPGNVETYRIVSLLVIGSNAHRAGFEIGDQIIAVDGRDVRLGRLFLDPEPGRAYEIRVRRGDEELELTFQYPGGGSGSP